MTFESKAEALQVWVAGPVDVTTATTSADAAAVVAPAPAKRVRVTIPADYLRLGLDDSARAALVLMEHVQRAKAEGRGLATEHLYGRESPIPPEQMGPGEELVAQLGLTTEAGRAWCGGYVALRTFLKAIEGVPALREIADTAVAKPGGWKLAKAALTGKANLATNIGNARAVDPTALGLMPVKSDVFLFDYSMAFGGTPVVEGALVVTAPAPPLDVSAGILGFIAAHPKDPRRAVHLRSSDHTALPRPPAVHRRWPRRKSRRWHSLPCGRCSVSVPVVVPAFVRSFPSAGVEVNQTVKRAK